MSFFSISSLLVLSSTLALTFFTLFKSEKKKVNLIWASFCFMAAVWGFASFQYSTTIIYKEAFYWTKISYIGAIFAPITFFHFIYTFRQMKKPILIWLSYAAGIFFSIVEIFFPEYFFGDGIVFVFNQFYWFDWTISRQILWLIFYMLLYWILLQTGFFLLLKDFIRSQGMKRNQLKYFIIGMSIGWLGAHGNFFINFGIMIYPYSNVLIAVYPIIITYAMLRHQLMDINVAIKRSLVYSLAVAFVTIIFIVLVLLIEKIIKAVIGYQTTYGSVLVAIFIGMIFSPVKNKIEYWINKIFYKGSQEEIVQQNIKLKEQLAQSERYKMLSDLTGGIATEIKNPLTAIMVYNDYFLQKLDDRAFLEKFGKVLKDNTAKINVLLQQLVEYSKPAPVVLKETNMVNLINHTIAFQRSFLVEKNIEAKIDFRTEPDLHLKIDPKQIGQALLHVIMNAVEAMPSGGQVMISTDKVDQFFRIIVRDTGEGIEDQYFDKLFDPFFTTKQGHTGLGLSITQGIIESHKGRILIKSQIKRGSEVVVDLPLTKFF